MAIIINHLCQPFDHRPIQSLSAYSVDPKRGNSTTKSANTTPKLYISDFSDK
ncbi:hypothetical protein HanRHA438_Chr10g0444891 [Helianthus annuus]|nr:hypothetical protein HanRHA438_Chr10g0444891 [Helianthus annuus]